MPIRSVDVLNPAIEPTHAADKAIVLDVLARLDLVRDLATRSGAGGGLAGPGPLLSATQRDAAR